MRTKSGLDVPDGWGRTSRPAKAQPKRLPGEKPDEAADRLGHTPEQEPPVDQEEAVELLRGLFEYLDEAAWLIEHSRCRFTDPKLRAQWILRKQKFLHTLTEAARDED